MEYLEGTRLTIVEKAPEGIEFTTRMVRMSTHCTVHALTFRFSTNCFFPLSNAARTS